MDQKNDFYYGVATASYQIEGGVEEREKNIWDTFSHQRGNIQNDDNGDVACDSYHRYEEDLSLLKELGVNSYRFSLSWSRLLKDGIAIVDERGVKYYRNILLKLRENHITPFVTLFHWDLPQCLQDQGGFLSPLFPSWFASYTKAVLENFGDLIENYITFNEPENTIYRGLVIGKFAPGEKRSPKEALFALHQILKAHGEAYSLIKEYNKENKVGFAICGWVPVIKEEKDYEKAKEFYFNVPSEIGEGNSIYLYPILLGDYPKEYYEKFKGIHPNITQEDKRLIYTGLDFIGANYYSGFYFEKGKASDPIERRRMDNGWYVINECVYYGLKFLSEKFSLPIIITENGTCDDTKEVKGRVRDENRIRNLKEVFFYMKKAKEEGVDLRGYFHWSLLDNFEWAEGYSSRFGLTYIDFLHQQKRIKKDSFYEYQKIIREKVL